MPELHVEPLVAAGYDLVLVAVAGALEWMGRHSNRRAGRFRTNGFQFRKHLDYWECPTGMRLMRAGIDNDLRVIRYQALPHDCNRCPIKANCTDSDNGREIEVPLDSWLATEIGRFHRGISITLLLLAASITAVELLRHDHGMERWFLAGILISIGVVVAASAKGLRSRPDSVRQHAPHG